MKLQTVLTEEDQKLEELRRRAARRRSMVDGGGTLQEISRQLAGDKRNGAGGNVKHLPLTANQWFDIKFPGLSDLYGDAVREEVVKQGITSVVDVNEDFLAATLGAEGNAEAPIVYVPYEVKFYGYSAAEGIYVHLREAVLQARLSKLRLEASRAVRSDVCRTDALEYALRDSNQIRGEIQKAKGQLEVGPDYFRHELDRHIAASNGMVSLPDNKLLPFAQHYRRRNKLAVAFDPSAQCPRFLKFLDEAFESDDIDTLQKCCGQALTGANMSEKIVLLVGLAGTGKTTLIKILRGIIGADNFAMLRTNLLTERFEIGRLYGRTILYAPDVDGDFLNHKGAAVLKSLTGHDPLVAEFKNSNEAPSLVGNFNAWITCNSRLVVRLQGDVEAWRRRLIYFDFHKPKPEKVIADLDQQILANEGSGVLNWMLEGLAKLRDAGWQINLTTSQQASVDNLLLESDSHTLFVREELVVSEGAELTVHTLFTAYAEYCNERGWAAILRNKFGQLIGDIVTRHYGKTVRHDIPDPASGKPQRGWRGLALRDQGSTEKHLKFNEEWRQEAWDSWEGSTK